MRRSGYRRLIVLLVNKLLGSLAATAFHTRSYSPSSLCAYFHRHPSLCKCLRNSVELISLVPLRRVSRFDDAQRGRRHARPTHAVLAHNPAPNHSFDTALPSLEALELNTPVPRPASPYPHDTTPHPAPAVRPRAQQALCAPRPRDARSWAPPPCHSAFPGNAQTGDCPLDGGLSGWRDTRGRGTPSSLAEGDGGRFHGGRTTAVRPCWDRIRGNCGTSVREIEWLGLPGCQGVGRGRHIPRR